MNAGHTSTRKAALWGGGALLLAVAVFVVAMVTRVETGFELKSGVAIDDATVLLRGPKKTILVGHDGTVSEDVAPDVAAVLDAEVARTDSTSLIDFDRARALVSGVADLPGALVVSSRELGGPATLAEPDSVLVRSFHEPSHAQHLSRFALDRQTVWTTSAQVLFDDSTPHTSFHFVWVGLLGGEPWCVVQAAEHRIVDAGDDTTTEEQTIYRQSLIKIDPATGAALERHPLRLTD